MREAEISFIIIWVVVYEQVLEVSLRKLTPVQRSNLRLAQMVGCLIIVIFAMPDRNCNVYSHIYS